MQFVQYLCTLPSNDTYGYIQALPLAKVYVYVTDDTGVSGALAQLYDAAGGAIGNPVTADINGFAGFAADDGLYNIQVTDADGVRNAPLAVKVQLFDQTSFTAVAGIIEQAVIGPGSSADGHFMLFDGTTGAAAKDTGLSLSTDGTLGANSDSRLPSEKAVKTAIAAAQQVKLSADTTYYVRTDGNDSNTGTANTSGAAWLTLQHAVDYAATLDLNTHTLTIQVGDGTYSAGVLKSTAFNRNGTVVIQGNTTTPSNCIISVASGDCLQFTNCTCTIKGFKLVSTAGYGLNAVRSLITVGGAMEYGACGLGHINATQTATISIAANYTISGGAPNHLIITNSAITFAAALTITLTGTPAFSTAFVTVTFLGLLSLPTNTSFSGSATGKKFIVNDMSAVSVGQSSTTGTSLIDIFPGDISGGYGQRQDGMRSFRNLIYNPDGRVQEGPSSAIGDIAYGLHNRWYGLTQTSTMTPTTILDVTDGVTHLIELTNGSSAQRLGYAQVIEGKQCKYLRGADVTLSGQAQRNQTGGVGVAIIEWIGTEDSVTKEIVNDWTNATLTAGNFFVSSNIIVDGALALNPSAGVLTNFLLQVTLGETFNNLIVFIWARGNATANTGTMDFRMQLESGRKPTSFERRPIEVEENLCHRFYESFTVQSENGARNIPLLKKRITPSITVGVGSASAITKNGFELTHSAAAACTVIANAEL